MQDLYSVIPNRDELHYVNQCFFTHINSSTEANMKDVYDFLVLVDMTFFFFFTLSIKVDFQASARVSVCDFCLYLQYV